VNRKRVVTFHAVATPRSRCPIASTLDVVGDKWTLLVVRDLLFAGTRRFADFLASSEGISTNILADRLDRLVALGAVERSKYQERPVRYEYHLTQRGRDLAPVLREIARWGGNHVPGAFQVPAAMECLFETVERPPGSPAPRPARGSRGRKRPVKR
jgi:DNA-binding HxlR family transcriptional regulator